MRAFPDDAILDDVFEDVGEPLDLDAIGIEDIEDDAGEPVSDWLDDRELALAIARGGLH